MDILNAKQLVIKAGKELVSEGLIVRTWGNVSCRIDDETFVVTPSGRDYLTIGDQEIVQVKIKDGTFSGEVKPSSERRLHGAIYKMRPEVNFIIHTHQEQASVVSAMGLKSMPTDEKYYDLLKREVFCAEYALPGTNSLCKKTAKAVKKSKGKAVILRNHGAVCFGSSYEEAFEIAQKLEMASETFIKTNYCNILPESVEVSVDEEGIISNLEVNKSYILNLEAEAVKFSMLNKNLNAYIDDFAQLVGAKLEIKQPNDISGINKALKKNNAVILMGKGILCCGKDQDEVEAVKMLVTKNCKAYFGAFVYGHLKPIHYREALYMRQVYLKQYSKLKG